MSLITDALKEAQRQQVTRHDESAETTLREHSGAKLERSVRYEPAAPIAESAPSAVQPENRSLREFLAVVLALAACAALAAVALRETQTSAANTGEVLPMIAALPVEPTLPPGDALVEAMDADTEISKPDASSEPSVSEKTVTAEPMEKARAMNDGRFVLSGILRADGRPLAVINGAIVREGDAVLDGTVSQIDSFGVGLETDGGTIRLSLANGSTELR